VEWISISISGCCRVKAAKLGINRCVARVGAIVVARQKDDPMAALDDRICGQGSCNQVIETVHELGAGERLRDEGGGRETVQLFRDWKCVTMSAARTNSL
jgi:hypothetical protein